LLACSYWCNISCRFALIQYLQKLRI